jgi:hypothetical protein
MVRAVRGLMVEALKNCNQKGPLIVALRKAHHGLRIRLLRIVRTHGTVHSHGNVQHLQTHVSAGHD